MTRALIFPGQGSQSVGMGQVLSEADKDAREVFQEVNDALGQDLSTIMWKGPADHLTLTENAQPALMAVSMAVIRILEKNGKTVKTLASHVAGHSLGEYTALAASGAFSLSDTAKLLKIRGQAMQQAVPVGEGAMAAILGLGFDEVSNIAQASSSSGEEVCVTANDNAGGQVVISGHKASVEKAIVLAKEHGAKRGVLLPVSAPFHSPLMAPAAERMAEALSETNINVPVVPVIANVTASPVSSPDEIKKLLVEQVTGTVRWRSSVELMPSLGITKVVEIGSGKVLSGLVRRINRDLKISSIETPDDIENFLKNN